MERKSEDFDQNFNEIDRTYIRGNKTDNGNAVSSIITEALFYQMLPYRNDPRCHGNGFYTHSAFIEAAQGFSGFGTTGDLDTQKRELAAFFGKTSQETTGGWANTPGGSYAWGYCYVNSTNQSGPFCPSPEWPCPPRRNNYGRGPIQLKYNYNYGLAEQQLHLDLINNPDQVATNALASFSTAIWFWMTPQYNKSSSHSVIISQWTPSAADLAAGRVPGYGVITNIIAGDECGNRYNEMVFNRIMFYQRFCDMLGVT